MKHILIALAALWILVQITSLIGLLNNPAGVTPLTHLTEPPAVRLTDPYRNAYFFLLGLASSAALDPGKVGYEIWVEARETSDGRRFDYDRPERLDLQVSLPLGQAFPIWDAEDPINAFRDKGSPVKTWTSPHGLLLERYDHCLEMSFEDRGFGQRATPRFAETMLAHRLYIADGFSRSTAAGLDRLTKELAFWRMVLREATTPDMTVAAQFVVQDDAKLISRIVSRPVIDKALLATALQLMVPLTSSEYSLRWPIRHQLAVAGREVQSRSAPPKDSPISSNPQRDWLIATTHLPDNAFTKIEHPRPPSFLGRSLGSREMDEMYAGYYEAITKASGTGEGSLPTLRQISGNVHRGFLEGLVNPAPVEPDWNIFRHQLMETDARLRLASLQIQLRRPSGTTAVPTRLAEVGSQYFDPFTGLPMLWSQTQQKIYSVGKDRLDDGADASFDIAAPALIGLSSKNSTGKDAQL
ncbi:MAG TPA: hypothetical protein PKA61_03370 [Nitrospira sp.]|nr:hypothetical protein [Nitrospira sp.]